MNVITVIGRITRDPEFTTYGDDKKIAKFNLAVNRIGVHGDAQDTDFFNCTAFGTNANFIEKHFSNGKGVRVGITGEARNNRFKDKDGNDKTMFEILVRGIDFADAKEKSAAKPESNDEFTPVAEEDLPFN